MNNVKLAICNDIAAFQGNRLADVAWADRFPGAGWFAPLLEKARAFDWNVVSGDLALSHVQTGYWQARDVVVVQELDSALGRQLRKLGAKPLLLTCLESPLYAGVFFDRLPELALSFPEVMAPASLTANSQIGPSRFWRFRFPCYRKEHCQTAWMPWRDRKDVALIAANKYWSNRGTPPSLLRPRRFLGWCRHEYARKHASATRHAAMHQLHDKRLALVEGLSAAGRLDIYGNGWNCLANLPEHWQKRLGTVSLNLKGPAANKLETIAGYKFAICYENMKKSGYLTEKIIDCIVAKTIPIYYGAIDISAYLPEDSYIDARQFGTIEALTSYIMSLPEARALAMIEAGQSFLVSDQACLHSYDGFAGWIVELMEEHAQSFHRQ